MISAYIENHDERASERESENEGQTEGKRERERAFLLPKRRRRSRHFLRLADCKCRVCTSYVEREKVGGERGGGGGNRIASYLSSTRAGNSEPRQKGARNGRKLHASNANPRLTVPLPLVSYRTPPPPPPSFAKAPAGPPFIERRFDFWNHGDLLRSSRSCRGSRIERPRNSRDRAIHPRDVNSR